MRFTAERAAAWNAKSHPGLHEGWTAPLSTLRQIEAEGVYLVWDLTGLYAGWGGRGGGRQPLVYLGLLTETFRVECVLTAPSSWCNFLHSFSFFLKSSEVAFLFLLLSLAKSFLFIISASLLTAWIFIVLSIESCFFNFSVAPSISLLMSLDFSRSRKKNGKKT